MLSRAAWRSPVAGLALVLALGAADDAAAQNVCRGDDPTNKAARINCQEAAGSSANIVVDASNLAIAETGSNDAIHVLNEGSGSVSVTVTASTLSMTGAAWVISGSADNNDMDLTVTQSTLSMSGWNQEAVFGFASGSGKVSIELDRVTLTASGRVNDAIRANNRGSGAIDIDITGGTITASGHATTRRGVHATHQGTGGIDIDIRGGAVIETTGANRASAIWAQIQDSRPQNAGTIRIRMKDGSLSTTGTRAGIGLGSEEGYTYGVGAYHENAGGLIDIGLDGVIVTTTGDYSSAVHGEHERSGAIDVALTDSTLSTAGASAHGVDTVTQGAVDIDVTRGSIATAGATAHGLYARNTGSAGAVDIALDGAVVTTRGAGAHGVWGSIAHGSNAATLTVGVTGGAVTAEGRDAIGAVARHAGLGSIALTVGAGAEIRAPFAIGAEGRLSRDANASGRLVVTHEGRIEARDAGVVAWAARRSGHTSGAGAQDADDAARTEPMIHVTSSGDIAVGAAARDAWIRAAIAGEDETLSAGEKAVFDAIVAADSDALDTALAALPAADYDAAWQARARALSDSRGHVPTDAGALANRAAEEIMGLTRSGIRALALSHEDIAGHVRNGDGDGALSAAERTALAAALTGGDLETALTALSATYTNTWKDTLREMVASYNAGDILVEVTGGTITAEGDGVDARYALTHDDNGAIVVTVADGATVSGGRHGIYVGGAGLVTGNADLRDQTVTVDGAVMGGTGAGVHLAGGGTVTVGETGRVGATSGDGILSVGAGDLVATVSGAVEGDIRVEGGGALTLAIMEGGSVTGTVRDPSGPLTVHGGLGRLIYSAGGTVTVAATGRITGVEGETGGILAEAGDLSVTVAGAVTGDLRAPSGGALTLAVMEGGSVTGTVHDPSGPLTVYGSVGRLLYSGGGTVTVGTTGEIAGVEGEAIGAEAGDLSVTVAGSVAGDLRAPSGGALTFAIMEGGSVTGTVHDPAGPLTVDGSVGRLLYSAGGTVTVGATGEITGVAGEAIRAEAGDLSVTVAGTVNGDLRAPSGGVLTFVSRTTGTVTGTVHNPAGALTVSGSVGRLLYDAGGTVIVTGTGRVPGVVIDGKRDSIVAATGDLSVTVVGAGAIGGDIRADDGRLALSLPEGSVVAGTIRNPVSLENIRGKVGRLLYDMGGTVVIHDGVELTGVVIDGEREAIRNEMGDLTVTATGAVVGAIVNRGAGALTVTISRTMTGDIRGEGTGAVTATIAGAMTGDIRAEGGDLTALVTGTVTGNIAGRGAGDHTVTVSRGGAVTGSIDLAASSVTVDGSAGRVSFDKGGSVTVGATGRIAGIDGVGVRSADGDLTAMVAGTVGGDILGLGAGRQSVTVLAGGEVPGMVRLAAAGAAATVSGSVGRVQLDKGGSVTVGATGRVTGVEGEPDSIRSEAGDLSVTAAGAVMGDIRVSGGALTLSVPEGGMVSGAAHGLAGPLTVDGSVGRLVYGAGGSAMVGATGRVTGVEGEPDAIRSEAGDLSVTAAGAVMGDIRVSDGGALALSVPAGGMVSGAAHGLAGPVTVDGSVGRLVYGAGGSAMVGATGRVTGVAGEPDAIRSKAGALSVTVAGAVTGGVRALGAGAHTVMVAQRGSVTGAVRLASGAVTVDGAVGGVLLDAGGSVSVGATGRVTGAAGEPDAIRSEAGDLSVTVAGLVSGGVRALGDGGLTALVTGSVAGGIAGLGAGAHMVTVAQGGSVAGGIDLASGAVTVDGMAGRVRLERGGSVTVGASGRLSGIDGVAVRGASGALRVVSAGRVEGDIVALGDSPAVVSIPRGGSVTGAIALAAAGGEVAVDGAAGSVRFERGGSAVVGAEGVVTGIDGVGISSEAGALSVTVRRAEGERPLAATDRIGGRIVAKDGAARIFLQAADAPRAMEIGPAGTRAALPDGAFDLGLERDADGGVAIAPRHAPRARVYEALPSVLLGLSDTPARDDRLSAVRGANGVWARVEVGGGAWEASRSTSTGSGAGVSYDRRGWSAHSGFDAPVGEAAMVGVSAHRREARATLADEDGRIDAAATGFGVSGSWLPGDGIYVDGQASASWFEADLRSGLRGALGLDRRGFGHALGVEAGRETPVGSDLTVTPRARLTGSRLEFDAFEDALGNPVSVDRARRVTGGAGALVEARPPGLAGSRLFGSLDVEREFSRETRVVVSESALVSEGPVGRLRVALGWSHEWGEGRHAAFAGARYAADAEGGQAWTAGLTLTARF